MYSNEGYLLGSCHLGTLTQQYFFITGIYQIITKNLQSTEFMVNTTNLCNGGKSSSFKIQVRTQ